MLCVRRACYAPEHRTAHHRFVRALALVVLTSLGLALASGAAAHPRAKGYSRGFQSKVLAVSPAVAGLTVTVVDGDDRLRVANESGTELLVLGYDGEPYLRIGPGGVQRNERSPSTYLNRDRFARVAVPASADSRAKPRWRRVSPESSWQWHDHRIQWMGSGPPPAVRDAPRQTHVIFDWAVPGRFGGRQFTITGRLDDAPPSEGGTSTTVVALAARLSRSS